MAAANFSNFVDGARDHFSNYVSDIPKNTGIQMIKGTVFGFVVTTVLTANPVLGLIAGAYSATASLIHGAVTPLFQRVIGSWRALKWEEEMLRGCLTFIATSCIALALGNPMFLNSLLLTTIIYGIFVAFNPESRSLDKTNALGMVII